MDPIATEFRRVRRQVERINRRVALSDIPGKVIAGSQDMDGAHASALISAARPTDASSRGRRCAGSRSPAS